MATFDEMMTELLEIDTRLAGLAEDDFGARFPLQARRADLKNEMAATTGSEDDRRSLAELEHQLSHTRDLLRQAEGALARNTMAGETTASAGAQPFGRSDDKGRDMNEAIDRATGRVEIARRIHELERVIAERRSET